MWRIDVIDPPILTISELMQDSGLLGDFVTYRSFTRWVMDGTVFQFSDDFGVVGFLLITNVIPNIQAQEDLLIMPHRQGKWATRRRLQSIGDLSKQVAFNDLMVQRLTGYIFTDNTKSIKVAEWLGRKREGTLKRINCVNGQWKDAYIYTALRGS